MEKEITIYEKHFDYEDMKIAMVVNQFFSDHEDALGSSSAPYYYEDYEDLVELCVEIRNEWNKLGIEQWCDREEYAYVQHFAEHYLNNKFLGE